MKEWLEGRNSDLFYLDSYVTLETRQTTEQIYHILPPELFSKVTGPSYAVTCDYVKHEILLDTTHRDYNHKDPLVLFNENCPQPCEYLDIESTEAPVKSIVYRIKSTSKSGFEFTSSRIYLEVEPTCYDDILYVNDTAAYNVTFNDTMEEHTYRLSNFYYNDFVSYELTCYLTKFKIERVILHKHPLFKEAREPLKKYNGKVLDEEFWRQFIGFTEDGTLTVVPETFEENNGRLDWYYLIWV